MKKVYFISYTNIKGGKVVSPAFHSMLDAARSLSDNFQFYFATCDSETSNIHAAPKWLSLFNKFFLYATNKMHIPYYISRTLSEFFFDLYYSFILRRNKGNYNLITTMYSPISAVVARSAGSRVSYISLNHDDNLYYRVVKEEKQKYGYHFTDVYDSSFRNRRYNRMISNVTDIAVTTQLVCDLFPSDYSKVILRNQTPLFGYEPKNDFKDTIEDTDPFVIGYIGHTVLLKGAHILAQAIATSSYKEKIILRICGKIDVNIKKIIDNTRIKVEYLGFIKDEKKNLFYNKCDLIVIPSIYDAGPTTILEAMECSIPLLISSGCGFSELFESYKFECVFETRNISALGNKIDFVIENYKKYVEIAKHLCLERVKNCYRYDERISTYEYIKNFAE